METSEKMTNMDALLFALSLEVVLLQMRILEGSTELRARQWQIQTKRQRQQRKKLVSDRDTVKRVIGTTILEISETGEWYTLQKAVIVLKQQADLAVSKRMQYGQLLRSRDSVIAELETKRHQWKEDLRNADRKTASLRDKINDDQLNASARLAYAEKWILARAESLELQFEYERPRAPPPRMDHEERVHEELLKAYEMQIQELEDSLKYWQQRHTIDTKDIKTRVAAKCEQLRVTNVHHEELQKLFNLHEGEMRAWLTFKRERAARLAREERLRLSATRIQAWWRGVMVRRALGSFKYLRNIKKPSSKHKKK